MTRRKILLESVILLFIMIASVNHGSAATVVDVTDLNQEGIIIALQSGTTSDLYAVDNLGNAQIIAFTSFDKVFEALENEDAHFALGDFPVLSLYASQNVGFEMIDSFSPEDFGIAVRQDSNELLDALDVAITNIVNDGRYDTIYTSWFDGDVVLTDDTDAETAVSYPTNSSGSDLSAILAAGKIVFGSDTTYPPFESLNSSGDVVGFDADIAHAIAADFSAHYGVTVVAEMLTTAWDPIIPDLQAENFDAILSAMTKTEARAQQVDFTRAYYTSAQGVLKGTKELPSDLTSSTEASTSVSSSQNDSESTSSDDTLAISLIPSLAVVATSIVMFKRRR